MVTVPVSVPPLPSSIVYVKLSVPKKPGLGVYVIVLSTLTTVVPLAPSLAPVTVNVSASTSVSLASTLIVASTS